MIDDYSRYMVELELSRSQTTDQVIEVYWRAVGEYGVPEGGADGPGPAVHKLARHNPV